MSKKGGKTKTKSKSVSSFHYFPYIREQNQPRRSLEKLPNPRPRNRKRSKILSKLSYVLKDIQTCYFQERKIKGYKSQTQVSC